MDNKDRMDKDLGFMLKYENVAWFEDGKVKILDRRVYPIETRYEICSNYKEVRDAIKNMVTQSAGPYTAAFMGMALAAYEAKDFTEGKFIKHMNEAKLALANARETTSFRMAQVTQRAYDIAKDAIEKDLVPYEEIFKGAVESLERRYSAINEVAKNLAKLMPDEGAIMTQCFGETIVGYMMLRAKDLGKKIKVYCPETRPFLQGARLTASVLRSQGEDVTVITDNMGAWTMKEKNISLFTSAADSITKEGYVVNKVGTLQLAICAKYMGIPYFVTGIPDLGKSIDDISIEKRDSHEATSFMGKSHVMKGVKGFYPAFDVTPPELVSAVVTDRGVFAPYDLASYGNMGEVDYY